MINSNILKSSDTNKLIVMDVPSGFIETSIKRLKEAGYIIQTIDITEKTVSGRVNIEACKSDIKK